MHTQYAGAKELSTVGSLCRVLVRFCYTIIHLAVRNARCQRVMEEVKSDGELSESGGEETSPPPAKKARGAQATLKTALDPRQLKKQEQNKKRKARKKLKKALKRQLASSETAVATSTELPPSSSSEAILAQLATLHPLTSDPLSPSSLTPPPCVAAACTGDLQMFRTAALQSAVLQLLVGEDSSLPGLQRGLPASRLAVIWLSTVSAELFLSHSADLFPGLSSLSPSLQLLLKHPGTDTFAILGLESFLFMRDLEKNGGERKKENSHHKQTKMSCLLSIKSMNKNKFPLPVHLQSKDNSSLDTSSGYVTLCGVWPAELAVEEAWPMFALDCEMVVTRDGHELARASIVDEDLRCIYDKLVKPDNPVLDYKTKFSGIAEETLRDVTTRLSDVQRDLGDLLPQQCILIGHSLENDFSALRMLHPYVIDTSCLFQTSLFKPKLRTLAKKVLGLEIQSGKDGHSSVQDAQACMELVLKILQFGEAVGLQKIKDRDLLTEVASQGCRVAIVDRKGVVKLFGSMATQFVVSSDRDTVVEAEKAVPIHDLTFIQLHSYEDLIKAFPAWSSAPGHMTDRVLRQMDSEACEIVASCPPETLVMVVCGSSDISRTGRLQGPGKKNRLKRVVAVARTGLALTLIT